MLADYSQNFIGSMLEQDPPTVKFYINLCSTLVFFFFFFFFFLGGGWGGGGGWYIRDFGEPSTLTKWLVDKALRTISIKFLVVVVQCESGHLETSSCLKTICQSCHRYLEYSKGFVRKCFNMNSVAECGSIEFS